MEPSRLNTTGRGNLSNTEGGNNNANLNVSSSSASSHGRGISPTGATHSLPTAHGVDSTRLPTGNNRFWYNPDKKTVLLKDLEPRKLWNHLLQYDVIDDDGLDEIKALTIRKRQAERMLQLLQDWFENSTESQRNTIFAGLCEALTGSQPHLIGYLNLRYVPQVYLEKLRLSGTRAFGHYPVQPVTEQLTGLQISRPSTASRQPVEHTEGEEHVPQPSVEVPLPYSTEESVQNPQGWW